MKIANIQQIEQELGKMYTKFLVPLEQLVAELYTEYLDKIQAQVQQARQALANRESLFLEENLAALTDLVELEPYADQITPEFWRLESRNNLIDSLGLGLEQDLESLGFAYREALYLYWDLLEQHIDRS